jgi:hypothetical protein
MIKKKRNDKPRDVTIWTSIGANKSAAILTTEEYVLGDVENSVKPPRNRPKPIFGAVKVIDSVNFHIVGEKVHQLVCILESFQAQSVKLFNTQQHVLFQIIAINRLRVVEERLTLGDFLALFVVLFDLLIG